MLLVRLTGRVHLNTGTTFGNEVERRRWVQRCVYGGSQSDELSILDHHRSERRSGNRIWCLTADTTRCSRLGCDQAHRTGSVSERGPGLVRR